MISKKHSIIIRCLVDKTGYITAEELSRHVGVSVRTIKRYISDINYFLKNFGSEIVSVKGIGYKLEGPSKEIMKVDEEARKIIEGFRVDDSLEGRITKVICILLNNEYVSTDEISEKLNISLSSTNNLIASVKDVLNNYELKIVSKPFHGSKVVGEENKIRSLILDYAIKIDENHYILVRLNNISRKEINLMEDIITNSLKDNNIIISDKDFNSLLIRIIVSISRVRAGNIIDKNAFQDSYRFHNYELVKDMMKNISGLLNIKLVENEVLYVSSSCGLIMYNYNTRKELIKNSKDEINSFVYGALKDINLITGIDFIEDTDFTNALIMHLKIFINRYKAGVVADNPLLNQIKSKFPVETNLATIIAKKLKEEFQATLDEDEIGFIAMHFGAAFERRKGKRGKKVCIICHYGIGTSQLLSEKLKQRISDISIVGIYPVRYLDIALKQDIDFIVSTVKLDIKTLKVPVLYIENVFSDEIINKLYQAFNEKDQRRKILKDTFNSKAFFYIKAKTAEEAIKEVGQAMKSKGFINDKVIDMVLEREKMSSTDIGNLVAIPHTILEGAYKSIIGVGVLEKPIKWNKEEVQLVFMVCFNRNESYNFPVFKYLYNFIEDENDVRSALKDFSFNKLMKIMDVK